MQKRMKCGEEIYLIFLLMGRNIKVEALNGSGSATTSEGLIILYELGIY